MWTYMPSGGLLLSLWEPVLLVDSRIPYGADNKKATQESDKRNKRQEFNPLWEELREPNLKKKKTQKLQSESHIFILIGMNAGLTISDDGIKQRSVSPHRLGCIRHHHIQVHLLCPILPQVGSDVLIRSSPLLLYTAWPTWKKKGYFKDIWKISAIVLLFSQKLPGGIFASLN